MALAQTISTQLFTFPDNGNIISLSVLGGDNQGITTVQFDIADGTKSIEEEDTAIFGPSGVIEYGSFVGGTFSESCHTGDHDTIWECTEFVDYGTSSVHDNIGFGGNIVTFKVTLTSTTSSIPGSSVSSMQRSDIPSVQPTVMSASPLSHPSHPTIVIVSTCSALGFILIFILSIIWLRHRRFHRNIPPNSSIVDPYTTQKASWVSQLQRIKRLSQKGRSGKMRIGQSSDEAIVCSDFRETNTGEHGITQDQNVPDSGMGHGVMQGETKPETDSAQVDGGHESTASRFRHGDRMEMTIPDVQLTETQPPPMISVSDDGSHIVDDVREEDDSDEEQLARVALRIAAILREGRFGRGENRRDERPPTTRRSREDISYAAPFTPPPAYET